MKHLATLQKSFRTLPLLGAVLIPSSAFAATVAENTSNNASFNSGYIGQSIKFQGSRTERHRHSGVNELLRLHGLRRDHEIPAKLARVGVGADDDL